ncbi:MAG TPA: DUF1801 domain-containing protein [Bryobacteraceae bacterium]|nr:DUF1801 domain-containing protein [Bryobacteraceae bacterium]
MAGLGFSSVDDYIASQPEAIRAILRSVRDAIREALPAAEELISYGMPTYKLQGAVVLYFAGWKRHFSLYPTGERLLAAFWDELAPYEVDKGTIRFPLSLPVPSMLIGRIAKFRADEVLESGKAKTGILKKRRTP